MRSQILVTTWSQPNVIDLAGEPRLFSRLALDAPARIDVLRPVMHYTRRRRPLPPPEPTRLSTSAIREYAERVGAHYGIYDRAGTADIRTLVRKLGGRIEIADTNESLHVNNEGDFVIYLPRVTSSRRDRFTIAHELGHYFLHYLHPRMEESAGFGRGERNVIETQANVFASSLLMPEETFRLAYSRSRGDIYAVARLLEVSPAAAEVRAQVLGLK